MMIYCISNQINYSSSFNIFAVLAGVFLIRGGLKTARTVRWLSAFFICSFALMLLVFPLFIPVKLLITQVKLNPVGVLSSIAITIILIALVIWVYLQLSSSESLEFLKRAGYKISSPKSALYLAVVLMILCTSLFSFIFNGETANKAKDLAQSQLGPEYNYHINNINWSGNSGSAIVTAYNSTDIKNIQVKW